MSKQLITPRTKILAVLEAWPELEPALIEQIPAFRKLQNPLLRRTVAKVATVQQAAAIAGIDVMELVNFLRGATGQELQLVQEGGQMGLNYVCPSWFSADRIHAKLDVRPVLEAGEHPVHEVIGALKALPADSILCALFPFVPVPLIEKASSLGFLHWIDQTSPDEVRVYFHADHADRDARS